VRAGNVIAFGVDTAKGKEGMVVVAEARPAEGSTDLAPLRAQVQDRVKAVAGLPAKDIVLVAPGTLPKTSSGKLQRTQCRARYLDGHLELVSV
jgi:fatty-acyl-CoA synthase